jgi:Zn-dependent protease with chaperone function
MFFARGIAVSFSVFAIVYCSLSVAVGCAWRGVWSLVQRQPSQRAADFLFGLRILPFVAAFLVTVAFAVPSFFLLEPREIEEPLGWVPLASGIFGAGLAISGVVNALVALRKASGAIAAWTLAAQKIPVDISVPVLRITPAVPAMTATGIVRPRILVSGTAESLLSRPELSAALNHEIAHVRRRDNLRKLLLRFVAFAGMRGLERAWLETSEMAADDAAVFSAEEALELASALIKLSRSNPAPPEVDLTAALVHSPASVMNARVERLIAWDGVVQPQPRSFAAWYGVGSALAILALFAVSYSQLLIGAHAITEWLVR